jgi:hypothetical protein
MSFATIDARVGTYLCIVTIALASLMVASCSPIPKYPAVLPPESDNA